METPDEKLCFKHATCWLLKNEWSDIYGYTEKELKYLEDIVSSEAYLIIEFSQNGGFDNASSF